MLRIKKEALIQNLNPEWKFLNQELLGEWPPSTIYHRKYCDWDASYLSMTEQRVYVTGKK